MSDDPVTDDILGCAVLSGSILNGSRLLTSLLYAGGTAWVCRRTKDGSVVLESVGGGVDKHGIHILSGVKVEMTPASAIYAFLERSGHEQRTASPGPIPANL